MFSKRTIAIISLTLGFVITTIAGLVLAASNLAPGPLLVRGFIVFIVVIPIFGFGIYQYVTSDTESSGLSDTELQLKLMDIIRQKGRISLEDLATELNVSVGTITQLVEDLAALDIFTGYIDWGNQIIYATRPQELPDKNP